MSRRPLIGLLLVFAAMVAGCSGEDDATQSAPSSPLEALIAAHGEPVKTYTVRAEVVELPDPARAGTSFRLRHEAIDDFIDKRGKVVGMSSMTMPFPVADGVAFPPGLKPGDKVQVTFAQWLEPLLRYEVYEIEALPSDTELVFRAADPPSEQPD